MCSVYFTGLEKAGEATFNMASNNNQNGWLSGLGIGYGASLSSVPEQQGTSTSDTNQFEQLDRSNAGSNTLKVPFRPCFHQ